MSDQNRSVVMSENFRKSVSMGESMINQLNQGAGQQENYTIEDLGKWGWRVTENFTVDLPTSALGGFATYLAKLGSVEKQWNSAFMVKHELQYGNGMYWPIEPTQAGFASVLNVKDGWIVSLNNFSPAYKASKKGYELPDLRHWSDINALMWADMAGGSANTLRFVFRHQIVTKESKEIIEDCMRLLSPPRLRNKMFVPWPGVDFAVNSVWGRALMGTAHGVGVAQMLLQHRREFGDKTVRKIKFFTSIREDSGTRITQYHLLFEIVDRQSRSYKAVLGAETKSQGGSG